MNNWYKEVYRLFRKQLHRKLILFAMIALMMFGTLVETAPGIEAKTDNNQAKIKNIIFLIDDGMGPTYNTAYRSFKDDPSTPYVEKTAFDEYIVCMQQTYSWDQEVSITDSAAAATTMASGVKTYNNAIAVDLNRQEVETVLEKAKKQGKSTGLVATSQVNHAT